MTPEQTAQLKKMYQTASVVGVAMMSSVFLYGFIAYVIVQRQTAEEILTRPDLGLLRSLLIVLAALSIPAARLINHLILTAKTTSYPSTDPQTFSLLVSKLFAATLVCYAMSETAALLGLILCIMSRNFFDFYTFAILSLVGFVTYFPRYPQWENWIKNQII